MVERGQIQGPDALMVPQALLRTETLGITASFDFSEVRVPGVLVDLRRMCLRETSPLFRIRWEPLEGSDWP